MSHTPGKWIVEPESCDERGKYLEPCVRTEEDDAGISRTIAVIRVGLEGMEANARLIAAAPELLEALKAIAVFCDDPNGSDDPESLASGLSRLLVKAHAAIAKAEGRQS